MILLLILIISMLVVISVTAAFLYAPIEITIESVRGARAGDPVNGIPLTEKIKISRFLKDKKGNKINPDSYVFFRVHGNSMGEFEVKENDIIFVKKRMENESIAPNSMVVMTREFNQALNSNQNTILNALRVVDYVVGDTVYFWVRKDDTEGHHTPRPISQIVGEVKGVLNLNS